MHLRMFDGWLQQFDQMQHHQKFVEAQAEQLRIQDTYIYEDVHLLAISCSGVNLVYGACSEGGRDPFELC